MSTEIEALRKLKDDFLNIMQYHDKIGEYLHAIKSGEKLNFETLQPPPTTPPPPLFTLGQPHLSVHHRAIGHVIDVHDALERYGWHTLDCASEDALRSEKTSPCNCGWHNVKDALKNKRFAGNV